MMEPVIINNTRIEDLYCPRIDLRLAPLNFYERDFYIKKHLQKMRTILAKNKASIKTTSRCSFDRNLFVNAYKRYTGNI